MAIFDRTCKTAGKRCYLYTLSGQMLRRLKTRRHGNVSSHAVDSDPYVGECQATGIVLSQIMQRDWHRRL